MMFEIYHPIDFTLFLTISHTLFSYSMDSLLEMIIGKVFPSPKKVYLKWVGNSLSSNLGGLTIDGGVGLSLRINISGLTKVTSYEGSLFTSLSKLLSIISLFKFTSLTHSSTTSTLIQNSSSISYFINLGITNFILLSPTLRVIFSS